MILAQMRRRRGRAVALLIGILVATVGFTVLTSDASAARLRVTTTIQSNARAAYDILVRPRDSRSAYEAAHGVVAPDFLSGQFGGITLDQWHQVQGIGGVDVAAPVAMLGYVTVYAFVDVDLTRLVDPDKVTQVIRVDRTWVADRGLTSRPDPAPVYVYVTRRPVVWGSYTSKGLEWSDGRTRLAKSRCDPSGDPRAAANYPIEVEPDGSERTLCETADVSTGDRLHLVVERLLPDGTFQGSAGDPADPGPAPGLKLTFDWPVPMLLAAVDPAAEARLVGLDHAVTFGRYLSPSVPAVRDAVRPVPVLATIAPDLDGQLEVSGVNVAVPAAADVATPAWIRDQPAVPRALASATSTLELDTTFQLTDEYRPLVVGATTGQGNLLSLPSGVSLARPGPVRFGPGADGSLRPVIVTPPDPTALNPERVTLGTAGSAVPALLGDTAFRDLSTVGPFDRGGTRVDVEAVGTFDPAKLTAFAPLSEVSMETYRSPLLTGANNRSATALNWQPLLAGVDPAGYVASPPQLITSLSAVAFLGQRAPISAIRVRVAGVTGVDPVSRERVRVAAQRIEAATGLDVDITVGSSPSARTIDLPAGRYGRPELILTEDWTRKGVALAVISALDRESLVLFVLILVVCVLFLTNAVVAAVRDRRRELAVLAGVGWPRARLAWYIAGEVLLIGLAGGLISAAAAIPVAGAAGVHLGPAHALLAVPVAVGLALVAAAVPAWRGSRIRGVAALTPTARAPRRGGIARRHTVAGMAAANLRRTPGRTLLGALALAIGVAAVTVLLAVTETFHGSITGSLLGDAVSLQVRGVDAVAVGASVALGLIAVADVVYLGVRERAAEFAALRATGWTDATLARLVAYEGVGIGLLGAAAGAGGGLAAAATFAGSFTAGLAWTAVAAGGGGVLLTAVACLVPARTQQRVPASTLLAEE